ncbi:MAG: hypothetical protein LUM44_12265 [Pyrinomonadaceae bacterium]|nr:hypothetical protein [Pyrinomonadaceae bacterium]
MKNFDKLIREIQNSVNLMNERIEEISREISGLEREILTTDHENEIDSKFAQIETLNREKRQKILLSRRAEIRLFAIIEEKFSALHAEARADWETAVERMADLLNAFAQAETAIKSQEAQIAKLQNSLASFERQIADAQAKKSELETRNTLPN